MPVPVSPGDLVRPDPDLADLKSLEAEMAALLRGDATPAARLQLDEFVSKDLWERANKQPLKLLTSASVETADCDCRTEVQRLEGDLTRLTEEAEQQKESRIKAEDWARAALNKSESYQAQIDQLQSRVKEILEERNKLEAQKDMMTEGFQKKTGDMSQKDNEISELKQKNQQMTDFIAKQTKELDDLKSRSEKREADLSQQLQATIAMNGQLQQEINGVREEIAAIRVSHMNEGQTWKEQIEKLEARLESERRLAEKEKTKAEASKNAVVQEKETAQKLHLEEVQRLHQEYKKKSDDQISSNEFDMQMLSEDLEACKQTLATVEKDRAQVHNQLAELQDKKQRVEQELIQEKENVKGLEQGCIRLTMERDNLRANRDKAAVMIKKTSEKYQMQMSLLSEKHAEEIALKTSEITWLKAEITRVTEESKDLEVLFNKVTAKLQKADIKNREYEEELYFLRKVAIELQKLRHDHGLRVGATRAPAESLLDIVGGLDHLIRLQQVDLRTQMEKVQNQAIDMRKNSDQLQEITLKFEEQKKYCRRLQDQMRKVEEDSYLQYLQN